MVPLTRKVSTLLSGISTPLFLRWPLKGFFFPSFPSLSLFLPNPLLHQPLPLEGANSWLVPYVGRLHGDLSIWAYLLWTDSPKSRTVTLWSRRIDYKYSGVGAPRVVSLCLPSLHRRYRNRAIVLRWIHESFYIISNLHETSFTLRTVTPVFV